MLIKKINDFIPKIDPRYIITENGTIYNEKTNKEIIPCQDNNGYLTVILSNAPGYRGVKTNYMWRVHRLVATCFCVKYDNCNIVDHIDRNRLNNHYTNLRWTTQQVNCDNTERSKYRVKATKNGKTYYFDNPNQAITQLNISSSAIKTAMKHNGDWRQWHFELIEK